jgi:hypothetical protein
VSDFGPGGSRFGEVCRHKTLRRKCETCDLADDLDRAISLLRQVQTLGVDDTCPICGAITKPHYGSCELANFLAQFIST